MTRMREQRGKEGTKCLFHVQCMSPSQLLWESVWCVRGRIMGSIIKEVCAIIESSISLSNLPREGASISRQKSRIVNLEFHPSRDLRNQWFEVSFPTLCGETLWFLRKGKRDFLEKGFFTVGLTVIHFLEAKNEWCYISPGNSNGTYEEERLLDFYYEKVFRNGNCYSREGKIKTRRPLIQFSFRPLLVSLLFVRG